MPVDAVELEVFRNLYHSIAEEMGAALRRTGFSPNIKERRDYSCAVFDRNAQVIAMGDHMPVHLGSMPMSVRAALDRLTLSRGDIAILNDPFAGGTHLPDITMVAPVFLEKEEPECFVASRAHHADVGGMHPGSMGLCESIYQEGIRIPPVKIVRGGEIASEVMDLILANVRTPDERIGDLKAQIAACHTGEERLRQICSRYGTERAQAAAFALHDYAERMVRDVLERVPEGRYEAEDRMDDDGYGAVPILRVAISIEHAADGARATVDFTGSSPQVRGSINAVEAITYSACFYVFRCLLREEVPASAGIMRPVRVFAPRGTVVNAVPPAAVAGGNVEMSQRIVDVLLKALAQAMPERIPAASYGTMSNITIGGVDDRRGEGSPFAYYETVAGGMGARPTKSGMSGIHMHMTNSLNTPAEALEFAYPLRVTQYSLRRNSGGAGNFAGGDGIVREIELLTDAEVTLLADRHLTQPYGLSGGFPGASGSATATLSDGSVQKLKSKGSVHLGKGSRVRIETPGGGGWGRR